MDQYTPTYLDLAKLEKDGPPPFPGWVVEHWIRMACTTLLLGESDAYKLTFVQQLWTTLAHGIELVSTVPEPRRVLAWMDADDDDLARRQHPILAHLPKPSGFDLKDRLFLESMADTDCTLLAKTHGGLERTLMLTKLREEIADREIEFVVLENVAKMFAGNQADSHEIMVFLAALRWAAQPMSAAILLLTDFAGPISARWERAVRARLWFSDRRPENQEDKRDRFDATPDLRYLFKRKDNCTAHDICSMVYDTGAYTILNPPGARVFEASAQAERLDRVLTDSYDHYKLQGIDPTPGRSSPHYLPGLIIRDKRDEGFSKNELERGILGRFKSEPAGRYAASRGKKKILVPFDRSA